MDIQKRLEIISRNTIEIIEKDELKKLLEEKPRPVTYCGYEPSGEIHLGHMVTVTKLIDLEEAGFNVKVLFADWHAWLNRKGDWNFINEQVDLWKKAFKKLGLQNPDFVLGSDFQRTHEYMNDLMTISLNTTVKRGLRSMQEIARDVEHATVSQIIYPLMQVNDIKHLGVDVAQSGIEQRKIHMLAREVLGKVNYKKPILVHTPLIESLLGPGKKMSSSIPESILSVRDSEKQIKKKIGNAYCKGGEAEGNPILQIAQLVIFPRTGSLKIEREKKFGGDVEFKSYSELEKAFAEKKLHPADLKSSISRELTRMLEPVRKVFG